MYQVFTLFHFMILQSEDQSDDNDVHEMSEYEKQRLANIRKNKELLDSLKINEVSCNSVVVLLLDYSSCFYKENGSSKRKGSWWMEHHFSNIKCSVKIFPTNIALNVVLCSMQNKIYSNYIVTWAINHIICSTFKQLMESKIVFIY